MNSFSFLKGGPTLCPFGLSLDPCSSRVDHWTNPVSVWTLFGAVLVPCGPFVHVLDPCLTGVGPWLICGFLRTISENLVG